MMLLTLSSFLLLTLSSAFAGAEKDVIISPRFIYVKVPAELGQEEYYEVHKAPSTGNANDYMDEVFRNLKKVMDESGLNELALPDQLLQFSHKVLGINVHGKIGLYNGYIRGIDTIHRTGDATIKTIADDLYIEITAGVTNAKLGYTGIIEFMNLNHRASFSGTVAVASAECIVTVKDLTNITLDYFHVKDIGEISVDVSGLGVVFDFLSEVISDQISNLVKNFVVKFFEGPTKEEIQKIINSIPIDHLIPDL